MEAEIYDAIAPYTCIGYTSLHREFISAVEFAADAILGRVPTTIVDIGSGTGLPLIPVLQRYPDVFAASIEPSIYMSKILESKLLAMNIRDRVQIYNLDIQDWLESIEYRTLAAKRYVDIVTTCHTLHHFEPVIKSVVYKNIYDALAPDGIFINGDLFDCSDLKMSKFFRQKEEDYLKENVALHWEEINGQSLTGKSSTSIISDWIDHLRNVNKILPITRSSGVSSLKDLPSEESLLRAAGFKQVMQVFLLGQSSILLALK